MKKTCALIVITLLILISCEVLEENTNNIDEISNNREISNDEAYQLMQKYSWPNMKNDNHMDNKFDDSIKDKIMNIDEKNKITDLLPDDDKSRNKLTTHYDTKMLDDRVRARAKALNVDPNTFRLRVNYDSNNNRGEEVYRTIGMHIIVNPDGSEVYLPDEI